MVTATGLKDGVIREIETLRGLTGGKVEIRKDVIPETLASNETTIDLTTIRVGRRIKTPTTLRQKAAGKTVITATRTETATRTVTVTTIGIRTGTRIAKVKREAQSNVIQVLRVLSRNRIMHLQQ